MYKTAETVSSNDTNLQYSVNLIDNLLDQNEYPRQFINRVKNKNKNKKKSGNKQFNNNKTVLSLPFLSNRSTALFNKAVEKSGLHINIVSKPGQKLKQVLTSSRPLDKPQCTDNKCITCRDLKYGNCTTRNCVYKITCNLCQKKYIGETYRPLSCRYKEHYRNAKNPEAQSYQNTPKAKHYSECHKNTNPDLSFKILDTTISLKERNIKEAKYIIKLKPELNNKEELVSLNNFTV